MIFLVILACAIAFVAVCQRDIAALRKKNAHKDLQDALWALQEANEHLRQRISLMSGAPYRSRALEDYVDHPPREGRVRVRISKSCQREEIKRKSQSDIVIIVDSDGAVQEVCSDTGSQTPREKAL